MAFSTPTLTFLRGLKRHNDRAWFEAHRTEYEADVKQPMRELIEEMDVRLTRFAPEIIGDPKRSMFRIYRDIRFSPDKSPYKTHASCWFYHRDGSRAVGREAEGGGVGRGRGRGSTSKSPPAIRSSGAECGCRRGTPSASCERPSPTTRRGSLGSRPTGGWRGGLAACPRRPCCAGCRAALLP